MKLYISTFLFLLSLAGCKGQSDQKMQLATPEIFAEKLASDNKPQLIDVRTPEEFAAGHLLQAENINWRSTNFEQQISKLDKSKPVLVYCKSGGRSNQAAIKLTELGFTNVYDLDGGITKWSAEGLPIETPKQSSGSTPAK